MKKIIKKILGIVLLIIFIPLFLYSLLALISGIMASFNLKSLAGFGMGLAIGFPIFLISFGFLIIAKSLITRKQ